MLPETIQVGPFTYTVKQDLVDVLKAEREMGEQIKGYSDHEGLVIGLDPKLVSDNLAETLLHEFLHTLFSLIGCPVAHEVEEELICRLSPVLLDTLRRNPDLVSYLTNKETPKWIVTDAHQTLS